MLYSVVSKRLNLLDISALYEQYVRGTKGRNHLIISEGVRKKYKEVNPDTLEDMAVVKDEVIDTFLFSIGYDLWIEILKSGIAPLLLSAYDKEVFEGVRSVLSSNEITFDEVMNEDLQIPFLY